MNDEYSFEIFKSNSSINNYGEQMDQARELFGSIYKLEKKVAVYVILGCVVTVGLLLAIKGMDQQELPFIKKWGSRIFACTPLVFSVIYLIYKLLSIN